MKDKYVKDGIMRRNHLLLEHIMYDRAQKNTDANEIVAELPNNISNNNYTTSMNTSIQQQLNTDVIHL